MAASKFVYLFLGANVCLLCGLQGSYVCIYAFILWLGIVLYDHGIDCVLFMYMRLTCVSIYDMICMIFRESLVISIFRCFYALAEPFGSL